jgi:hypothetical protein
MSLYRTLSQLPNDLPLTLGKKVDPNTAKPQSDPLDAWFTVAPQVKKAKGKRPFPKLTVNVVNPCVKKELTRALEAHLQRVDEQHNLRTLAEIIGEAKQIVGTPALKKVLIEEFGAKYIRDLKSEHYAAFIEKTVALVRKRIEQDSRSGLPLDYNLPTWV